VRRRVDHILRKAVTSGVSALWQSPLDNGTPEEESREHAIFREVLESFENYRGLYEMEGFSEDESAVYGFGTSRLRRAAAKAKTLRAVRKEES